MALTFFRLALGVAWCAGAVSATPAGLPLVLSEQSQLARSAILEPLPADAASPPAAAGLPSVNGSAQSPVPSVNGTAQSPVPSVNETAQSSVHAPAPSPEVGTTPLEESSPQMMSDVLPTVPQMTVVPFPTVVDALPTIDATVTERISRDSERIGSIATKLVSVQKAISKVEKEALDKVFDIHSIKSFLNEHQAAVEKERHLDQEILNIAGQEKSLTGKLTQANVDMDVQQTEHDTRVQKLKLKLTEGDSKIQQARMDLERGRTVQKETKVLPRVNEELQAKDNQEVEEEKSLEEELRCEQDQQKQRKEHAALLGMQLKSQQAYKEKCIAKIGTLKKAVSAVEDQKAAKNKNIADKLESMSNTQHGLLTSNDALRQRLHKSQHNQATIQAQLAAAKRNLAALQNQGKVAVETMQKRLALAQQEAARLDAQLAAKITNLELLHKDIMGTQMENFKMNKQIEREAGFLMLLKTNHSQLKQDLVNTGKNIKLAEVSIDNAKASTQNSKARTQAMQKEAKASAEKLAVERKKLLAEVAAAKKQNEELDAKLQAVRNRTQSSILKDCDRAWKQNHTEVYRLLGNCDKMAEELKTTRDHVDGLKQALSARASNNISAPDAEMQGRDRTD